MAEIESVGLAYEDAQVCVHPGHRKRGLVWQRGMLCQQLGFGPVPRGHLQLRGSASFVEGLQTLCTEHAAAATAAGCRHRMRGC